MCSCGTLARKTENTPTSRRAVLAFARCAAIRFSVCSCSSVEPEVAAVLDHDGEAAGPAHAAHRRRPEDGHLRLGDLRP